MTKSAEEGEWLPYHKINSAVHRPETSPRFLIGYRMQTLTYRSSQIPIGWIPEETCLMREDIRWCLSLVSNTEESCLCLSVRCLFGEAQPSSVLKSLCALPFMVMGREQGVSHKHEKARRRAHLHH